MTPTQKLQKWYEELSPETLTQIRELYSKECVFKDPFHEIHGTQALEAYFSGLFTKLESFKFEFSEALEQGSKAYLVWDFHCRVRGYSFKIHGASLITYDEAGRVKIHRDYWDPAEELYEKIPVLGFLMKNLKKLFF